MAVLNTDIKYYKSNATNSTGGTITATEITSNVLENIFPIVSASDALAGLITYRKIFIKNTHASDTLYSAKCYISSLTTSAGDEIDIALGSASDTDPSGLTFTRPTDFASGLSLDNLASGDSVGLWLKRVVSAGAGQIASNSGSIAVKGETA